VNYAVDQRISASVTPGKQGLLWLGLAATAPTSWPSRTVVHHFLAEAAAVSAMASGSRHSTIRAECRASSAGTADVRCGQTLPTWALQQVGTI
jgi:hypothetical protein